MAQASSLSDLREVIAREEAQLQKLRAKRERLAAELDALAGSIAALRGVEKAAVAREEAPVKPAVKRRKRRKAGTKMATKAAPASGVSLGDAIMQVLGKSRKGMTAEEIAEGVAKTGYDFGKGRPPTIVSMTLGRMKGQVEKTKGGKYRAQK
jgi:hypothetical protein